MRKHVATALSVLAASVAPALVFALALPAFDQYLTSRNLVFYFLCAAAVSAAHALILGLPVCFTLQRSGRFGFWSVALSGFAIGGIPTAMLLAVQAASAQGDLQTRHALATVGCVGLLGAVGAACFYSVHTHLKPCNA